MKTSIKKQAEEWEAKTRALAATIEGELVAAANTYLELAELKSTLIPRELGEQIVEDTKGLEFELYEEAVKEAKETGAVQHALALLDVHQQKTREELDGFALLAWREAYDAMKELSEV